MKKKKICMVGASFRKCLDFPFTLEFFGGFWLFFLPSPIQKQCFRKAKVQFYCTGATTDFCVDNQ